MTVYDQLGNWNLVGPNGKASVLSTTSSWESTEAWLGALPRVSAPAGIDSWQRSIGFASECIDAPDEYLLLRDAQSALDRAQFRRAVIDAGAAVELAITRALDERFDDPAEAEVLLSRHRTLGRRIALAKRMGLALPPTLTTDLLQARNSAAHSYERLSKEIAGKAVVLAQTVVAQHVPLPEAP